MKRRIKLLAFILTLALVLQTLSFASVTSKNTKTVFVDGVKYEATIENVVITLKSVGVANGVELVVNPDSTGTIKGIYELDQNETAQVLINELGSDHVDVEIKSRNRAVKRIQGSVDTLGSSNKEKTMSGAAAAGAIILGDAAIKALLATGMAVTVGTALCYAITEVKAEVKKIINIIIQHIYMKNR